MERWVSKLIAFFLIFITMTISGLLPIKVEDWFHRKGDKGLYYLSIISCFGGGVFFGAYLMHMAPEVREILEESFLIPQNITYPIPELMTAVGFFLLLYVDKIVLILSTNKVSDVGNSSTLSIQSGKENSNVNGDVRLTTFSRQSHIYDNHALTTPPSSPRIIARGTKLNIDTNNQEIRTDSARSRTASASQNGHVTANDPSVKKDETVIAVKDNEAVGDEHVNDESLAARPYIFLVALSIDCIFEGMSLGLQSTSLGVWMLVIAILSHELVICFSFGLRILKLFPPKKVAIIIVLYASTIPIGIAIGFIIFETAGASDEIDTVSGFFQAISAGIFIYVSFFEILNEELTHDTYISKVVSVTVGFVFMALMVLLEMIENDDGSGDSTTVAPIINATGIYV